MQLILLYYQNENNKEKVKMMIEKLRGPENIMHRNDANPIITVEDFPVPVDAVFNCGQTMYNGQTVLLIAALYKEENASGSITGIHVARSNDGINFEIDKEPFCDKRDWAGNCPGNYDCWVIDPRITKIDDTYYIIRPAQVSNSGPAAVLEKTKDFKTCEFIDCIALPSNRVPCLFPEKIGDYYVRLDRPYNLHDQEEPECIPDSEQLRAGIWISYSPDLIFWGKHRPLVYPESISKYANWKMGPTPPIKTKEGWLEIIHGVFKENSEFCYSIGVMLLDLDDPQKIIGVSDNWILTPTESYETNGRVENVVFPCGAIADHETDTLRIYYGAADTCIGLATGKISELVAACKAGQTASESIAERQ